jgi:hypothetical protein
VKSHTIMLALLTVLSGASPQAASGQPFRYVDENGVTVYSQTPPPGASADAVELAPAPSAADTDAAIERLRGQIEQQFDQRQDQARAKAAEAEEAKAVAQRAEACATARQNRQTLQDLGARMLRMPDGSVTRIGDAERQAMLDEADRQIVELCN